MQSEIIVIGLGNPYLSDDSVGLQIVDRFRDRLGADNCPIKCKKIYNGGFDLLQELIGHRQAVIVDALYGESVKAGELVDYQIDVENMDDHPAGYNFSSSHGLHFPVLISMAKMLGYQCPEKISVVGVGVQDVCTFSETPTPQVSAAIDQAVEMVERKIREALKLLSSLPVESETNAYI